MNRRNSTFAESESHGTAQGRRRPGAVIVYAVVALVALILLASLAVDYARVQEVKTDLQKAADATARGCLALNQAYGLPTAQSYGPIIPTAPYNPIESGTGPQPTTAITWGSWNSSTSTFTAGTYNPPAVKVTMSRTAANGNGVPLTLAGIFGRKTSDVTVTAIATAVNYSAQTISVAGTSDPWLSAMPSGSTASYDDVAPGQSPPLITLPTGSTGYLTFTNISGTVAHGAGLNNTADGNTSQIYSHGADSPGGPTPAAENGIGDITCPINALVGVFLDNSQPDSSAAPAALDYSTSASRDSSTYSNLKLKQPFFIGDGLTSGGTVQQFQIPPGATRLCLGPMDGHEWKNNTGSFSVTLTQSQSISIVK